MTKKKLLIGLSLPKRSCLFEVFFTVMVIQSLFLTKFYANFKTKKHTVKPKKNLSIFLSFPTLEKSQKNSVYEFNH